jgi:hypothetical protein
LKQLGQHKPSSANTSTASKMTKITTVIMNHSQTTPDQPKTSLNRSQKHHLQTTAASKRQHAKKSANESRKQAAKRAATHEKGNDQTPILFLSFHINKD